MILYSLRLVIAEGAWVVEGVTVVTGLVTTRLPLPATPPPTVFMDSAPTEGGGGTCSSFQNILGLDAAPAPPWIMVVGRSAFKGSLGRMMFGRFRGRMLGLKR